MSAKVTKLKNLSLERVSLCNEPICQDGDSGAFVVLYKAADKAPEPTTTVEKDDDGDSDVSMAECPKCEMKCMKGAVYCSSCGERIPKSMRKSMNIELDKITDPEVRKAVEKLQADNAELLKAKAPETKPEEAVLKGMTPEQLAVVEKMKADTANALAKADLASKAIAKMEDERVEKAFIEKARGYEGLSLKPEEFGPVMKAVAAVSPEQAEALHVALTAASKASKLKNFSVVGAAGSTNANTGGSAADEILAKAQELVEKSADKKLSIVDAQEKVIRENPALYKRYMAEVTNHKPAVGEDE